MSNLKSFTKRALTLLLALVMVVSYAPVTAFAAAVQSDGNDYTLDGTTGTWTITQGTEPIRSLSRSAMRRLTTSRLQAVRTSALPAAGCSAARATVRSPFRAAAI